MLEVEPDTRVLERFEVALRLLQPRVALARPAKRGDPPVPFWADSVVRPLVAENLAQDRPWYQDFRRLVVSSDGSDDAQRVRHLRFERKGLQIMIQQPWEDRGEEAVVRAVHNAMGWRFTAIRKETNYDPATGTNKDAYFNRRERQMQRAGDSPSRGRRPRPTSATP